MTGLPLEWQKRYGDNAWGLADKNDLSYDIGQMMLSLVGS